ncbi:MAG: hypothetical protein AAF664_15810 [Planctomycetota bacterium]
MVRTWFDSSMEASEMPFLFRRSKVAQSDRDSKPQTGFRCAIDPEQGSAFLKIDRKRFRIVVQENGIDGLTILVPKRMAGRLKLGRNWLIEYRGEVSEVHPQWVYQTPDGDAQVAVQRLCEVTPEIMVNGSWWTCFFGGRQTIDTPLVGFALVVVVLFCTLALPGIGDDLGTADRIEDTTKWIFFGAKSALGL